MKTDKIDYNQKTLDREEQRGKDYWRYKSKHGQGFATPRRDFPDFYTKQNETQRVVNNLIYEKSITTNEKRLKKINKRLEQYKETHIELFV